MKLKGTLYSIIVIGMFVTGCTNNQDTDINQSLPNDAVKQKMMTKVQNDVNEILNKDYDYVIKNMGEPYCTTYYIDSKNVDKIEDVKDIRLIYPKNSENNKLDKSALYIDLHDSKVSEVQTYEMTKNDLDDENLYQSTDIVVDKYSGDSFIPLEKIEKMGYNKYLDKSKEQLYEYIGNTTPNVEVYNKSKDEYISIYKTSNENNFFTVTNSL